MKTKTPRTAPARRDDAQDAPPPMPACLDGAAAAEWARLAPILHRAKPLDANDAADLTDYCLTLDRYLASRWIVEHDGRALSTLTDRLRRGRSRVPVRNQPKLR